MFLFCRTCIIFSQVLLLFAQFHAVLATSGYQSKASREHKNRHMEIDGRGARLIPSSPLTHASSLEVTVGDSIDKPSLGAIALLVNSSDLTEMSLLEANLVPSLMRFLKFKTPVIVLHSGPHLVAKEATVRLALNPKISLSLVDVTLRVDQFARRHAQKYVKHKKVDWKLGEFWTMHMHLMPELQKYRYIWRLSPRSVILSDISTNLYEVMRQQNAAIGYRLLQSSKPGACVGLQEASRKFYDDNHNWAPRTLPARAFLEMYEEAKCPLWTPDFEIVDLGVLREHEAYGPYVNYLADQGGFAKHGWDEHMVQALFVGTQGERMLCMTPWVPIFSGQSRLECDDDMGLSTLFQQSVKDYLSTPAQVLQVKELHPKETHWRSISIRKPKKVGFLQRSMHRVVVFASKPAAFLSVCTLLLVCAAGVAVKRKQLAMKSEDAAA